MDPAWPRQLYLQCKTYIRFDRVLLRSLVLLGLCLWLVIAGWHFVLAPEHRVLALALLASILSFAAFYDLTLRDAPSGMVLALILFLCGGAGALWLGLALFYRPLANDQTPLAPAGASMTGLCPGPAGALHLLIGPDDIVAHGAPFRVGTCPAPAIARTAHGLRVTGFGYDDDGNTMWQLKANRFDRLEGDYLHVHRQDASSLGLYDRWEREIFFIRYLAPDAVRIRVCLLFRPAPAVTISDDAVEIGSRRFTRPRCLTASPNYAPRVEQ